MLQEFHLQHMPPGLAVYVALYREVQNASYLHEQLLTGNTDFEYAFIDASMVLSTTHLLAAAFRAMNDYLHERLKSRNIHSEIVFALSPNNNIGEAFRRFGISDTTKDLFVLKVSTAPSVTFISVREHLQSAIRGVSMEVNKHQLHLASDIAKIRRAYKIAPTAPTKRGRKACGQQLNGQVDGAATRDETKQTELSVLSAIALRGAT